MSRLIDDDALKRAIVEEGQKSKRYKIGEFWELNGDEIWQVIDAQPTIETEPHWIPVSERLPEKDGYYLVSEDDGNIEIEWYDNTGWGYCGVIAWMFLPTPYRKEPNDEMVCYEVQREDLATKDDKRFFNALKPNKEIDRSWGIGMKVPACPNCEAIISPMCFWKNCGDKVGWCEYCGQKIDWSGWEEE